MRTLYIVGNGFDIAHGINTPYADFRKFLEVNAPDFLADFESMYDIIPLDPDDWRYTEERQKNWDKWVQKILWRNFEDSIGLPDVDSMYSEAEAQVDGMPERGVKDTLDYFWKERYKFSENLQTYVLQWIQSIDISGVTCKKKCLENDNEDFFLSFNYTETLEKIYGVRKVLHIHGGIPTCTSELPIMGHGNQFLIEDNLRKAKQYLAEGIEWSASIHEAIAQYAQSIYKDTDKIIQDHDEFFSSLDSIDQIICIGISFGDVDIPYLERIEKSIRKDVKWLVYYYDKDGKERLKNVFGITGISRRYETYFIPSTSFWDQE